MTNKEYNHAIGRRKETSAIVKLFAKWNGTRNVKTNSGTVKSLKDYFGWNHYLFENAISPLTILWGDYLKKFDMEITINWWWISGQSDAIKLGIARALIQWNSELRLTLKPYGMLKRDPRIKERKKPWLKKARKRPTWSKR